MTTALLADMKTTKIPPEMTQREAEAREQQNGKPPSWTPIALGKSNKMSWAKRREEMLLIRIAMELGFPKRCMGIDEFQRKVRDHPRLIDVEVSRELSLIHISEPTDS